MPVPHSIITYQGTHIGRVRRLNEDALFVNEQEMLWLVADGIGGHGNGEKASATVVEHVESYRQRDSIGSCMSDITARLREANQACRNTPGAEIQGTTVAALLMFQTNAVCVWAGDSRVYRLRGGELTVLTEDHNLAQERYRRGELSLDAAQRLPAANVLTKAVGTHHDLNLEVQVSDVEAGDRFLISTDGLYKELTLEHIKTILGTPFGERTLTNLIDEALQRGGKDNITGIVVDVGEYFDRTR